MFRVTEYFAKSQKVTQDYSKWHPWVRCTYLTVTMFVSRTNSYTFRIN